MELPASLARSARNGSLTVTDNRGRVLAETASNSSTPFPTLPATVPGGHEEALFQLWGDWFGWVAVGLLVLVLGRLWGRRRAVQAGTARWARGTRRVAIYDRTWRKAPGSIQGHL